MTTMRMRMIHNLSSATSRRLQILSCCSASHLRLTNHGVSSIPRTSSSYSGSVRYIGGSIGRMLDLGGMPSATNDSTLLRPVDGSKNSKLQAVAFDFRLLTNLDGSEDHAVASETATTAADTLAESKVDVTVHAQPDLDRIEQVASLLNVSVDTTVSSTSKPAPKKLPNRSGPGEDIRAKYAKKLKSGIAGIELAKSEVQDTLTKGDAAGHWSARKLVKDSASGQASQHGISSGGTRWMAMSGTGKLLSHLTHRAIKIALLPDPRWTGSSESHQPMYDLSKQLPEVVVDVILNISASTREKDTNQTTDVLAKQLIKDLDLKPQLILVVSDRDDYLRAARDLGMMTCRLQRKNARRGNITALYKTESIPQIQEVVNEINGISFNAVLNR